MTILLLAACLPLAGASDRITAADLARAEPGFSAVPPDTPMGYGPAPGTPRIFGVAELARQARRYGLDVEPKAEICVERPVEPLSPAAVLEAIQSSLGLPQARIEIVEQSRYPVPHGALEFPRTGLIAPSPAQPHAAALWRGAVRYAANRRFAIWARVRILARAQRVVAGEALPAGRPIEAAQLRLETYEGFPLRTEPLDSIGQAAGRVPRRSIARGAALSPGELDSPYEVSRGDTVRVGVWSGDAHLELNGRAEASGRRGQTIPVRNPANGKRFQARVEGAGRVEVGSHP
jgi:flagella basal body P-ring formation protein FlgA